MVTKKGQEVSMPSSERIGTKRMVGKTTASATAEASLKSFFWDLTNGLTYCAGSSLTS